ncbi:Zn(II)2Cys6 transcription factor domain-containing protein [Aspergillus mulundensis]|uniref:Zn(2)-C6 fungal-type domain-containing protein n=1 Tax=Aspergillus mulundensis TaxID=1810919 RepID=A0A3D8REH7_9EURO|nr:Uncharacterized protein DSM5745_07436 [Aspergillus mulundensis]RDW72264.1 Uncharacterized protein DSM5745_07436 [Aspergillus mulundensis]
MTGEQEIQFAPVLRCGLCNKPFDKQSTLKRHGYYCRSRGGGRTARSRSCVSCAKRKARCDNRRPGCSRCLAKGFDCHYPAATSPIAQGVRASTNHGNYPSSLPSSPPDLHNDQENGDRLGALDIADPSLTALNLLGTDGEDLPTWNTYDIEFPPNFDDLEFDFLSAIPEVNKTLGNQHSLPANVQPPYPQVSVPSPLALPRLLTRRPESVTGGKRTTHLILQTLKSYVYMMLHENALPPFIHARSISQPVDKNSQEYSPMGPLDASLNILRAIKNSDGRQSFWNHVRTQCEQLCSEQHRKLDNWELLGAMQALCIYILVRLDEGETNENNLDFLLLAGATVLANKLGGIYALDDRASSFCGDNNESTWDEWIFEESRRRVSIIYRIINILTYFQPAAKCDLPTDLILAPLPAKKPLWEANDWALWKIEAGKEPTVQQTAFGLARSGELVRLDKAHGQGGLGREGGISHLALDAANVSRSSANWEEWCSGMDAFGGLVMLAAALVA